jgi:arsenite methyltransferase
MEENIKTIEQKEDIKDSACGCGSGGCGCQSHDHSHQHAHVQMELPVRFQILREGDRVVEFGSGTGNDSLAAAQVVGPKGKVIGIDISEKNIMTARDYMDQLRISNVEFRVGDIASAPIPKEYANIVFSNCVFSLQENKQKVADEMYRVTDHHGLVCISDFVTIQPVPEGLKKDGGELAGCIAGAENIEDFMEYFRKTGFINLEFVEMNKVHLPDDIFQKHLTPEQIENYKSINSDEGIFSVTLIGEKPESCSAETCCCNPDKHKN